MTAIDPAYRRHIAEQTRQWRDGYQAGSADRKRRHWLVTLAVVLGGLVLFRRWLVLGAAWAVLWVLAVLPLLVVALAVETTYRTHRAWGSWRRTLAVALTWLAGFGLVILAILTASPWFLLPLPVAALAWWAESRWKVTRKLRYVEPEDPLWGTGQ